MMNKLSIVIATLGLEFTGNTLEKEALGGSETAVIYTAKEFAKMGHDVRVYCNCPEEGIFDGVLYKNIAPWDTHWRFIDCDIFIVSRFFDLGRAKINSKLNILWNHDICSSPEGLMSAIWNYDYMYCLSEYHKQNYLEKIPEAKDFIKLNSNGVDFILADKAVAGTTEKKHKIMFTSRPERGLMDAIGFYEAYGDKDLEFLVCNYKTFDTQEVAQIEKECFAKLQDLGNKGFNVKMGRFTKEELYKNIAESKMVIYPTNFPEIFCISAVEAQACGTIFLTTDDFAMKETVGYDGVKGEGKEYAEAFLKKMKKYLTEENYRISGEKIGRDHAQKYSWDKVAGKFISDAMAQFKVRSVDIDSVLRKLCYESDLVAARELAKKHNLTDWVQNLDHQLRFVDKPELTKEIYEKEETHERIDISQDDLEHNTRFAWLADMVKEHKIPTLLDYACHMGLGAIITSNRNPEVKITGYDISERAIDKAKKRVEQYATNKQNLSFTSNRDELKERGYDALFCGEYLEHVLDVEAEVARLEKYVKVGGKILFTVPRGAWEWISREENVKTDVVYHVNNIDYWDVVDLFGHRKDFKVLSLASGEGSIGEICGQTLIQYTVADGESVGKRNFERKFLTTRQYQGISACIIAKDASKDIEHCLDSFYNDVDEVLIAYDPASKDKADFLQRVSKYYNVKVFDMPKTISKPDMWGFANARNFILEKAIHKWILWIDTDERMIKSDFMKKYLDTPFLNGYTIKQHHAQLDNFVEADKPTRLFRRGVANFVGYIHEQPQDINDINKPIEPALVLDMAKIVNFGMIHEGMRRDKAINRNLDLLKVDALENVDKRKKAGLPVRKLTMILIMRDFFNRMQWGYEKYKTFQTKDVMEHCLPRMKGIYKEYFENEPEILYKEMADKIMNTAYEAANVGIPCEVDIGGIKRKMRVDLDGFDNFKKTIAKDLENATKPR